MPTRTYMVVDVRRDHAIRVPRPDLSVALSVPNACNNCHTEHTAQWAADHVTAWYDQNRRAEPHFGSTIDAAQKEQPDADTSLTKLILNSQALSLLPNYAANTGPEQAKAYRGGLQDADPLVRMAAVDALASFPPDQRVAVIAPLLNDPVKAVRIAAARSLAAVPTNRLSAEHASAFERAAAELIAAEQASVERPETQISIGAFEAERGHIDRAEAAYRAALRIDPRSAPAMLNLADLYRSMGDDTKAEPLLRQAIAAQPSYAPAYHALGLLLVRLHNAEALSTLEKAAVLAPEEARYAYVYAIALNSAGRPQDAIGILKTANARHPVDAEILIALSTISRDLGDHAAAVGYAKQFVDIAPNSRQARSLLNSLRPD